MTDNVAQTASQTPTVVDNVAQTASLGATPLTMRHVLSAVFRTDINDINVRNVAPGPAQWPSV